MQTDRRQFLGSAAGLIGLAALGRPAPVLAGNRMAGKDEIASNVYPWLVFFQREGRNWAANLDSSLGAFAQSGIKGFEPSVTAPEQVDALVPLLKKHGLWMTSLYVNSTLHEAAQAEKSIQEALAIADAARRAGVKIVVTNPSPIRWGGPEDKTDAQLETQAAALDRLGAELRRRGLVLAYHNHDPEMRRSAREFHHMMLGTDPENVKLCLDAHWIYRGAGNSQVALFDIVRLYGPRIVEVHLRQSRGGIWSEDFGEGDIDYARLAAALKTLKLRPLLVLEQAIEKDSPNTMDAVAAHRKSLEYAATFQESMTA